MRVEAHAVQPGPSARIHDAKRRAVARACHGRVTGALARARARDVWTASPRSVTSTHAAADHDAATLAAELHTARCSASGRAGSMGGATQTFKTWDASLPRVLLILSNSTRSPSWNVR